MDECPCIITTDDKFCIDCGKPVDEPFLTVGQLVSEGITLGPAPPSDIPVPEMGNIVGIMHLAQNTVREFQVRLKRNSDPSNPTRPRLRMVGSIMLRVPHEDVWHQLVVQSFEQAKAMGYRGTLQRWQEIVNEPPSAQ